MVRVEEEAAGAPAVAGVVLCGGHSRRMGSDKALLVFGGERLVDRAVRRLRAVADPVLLACGARPVTVAGCETVNDAGDAGPLGGIVAGLRASPHALTAVVAVDMPWLDPALLRLLATGCGPDDDAVVPVTNDRRQPLHAVYARSALPTMERALDQGVLTLGRVLETLRVRTIDVAGRLGSERAARFSINLNTRADLLTLGQTPRADA
jgi:molybdopterin-guanine dinucleotide biosynthesis protein A